MVSVFGMVSIPAAVSKVTAVLAAIRPSFWRGEGAWWSPVPPARGARR
jgi:hypothetical protein